MSAPSSDAFFDHVAARLCEANRAVVMADPGAGKTTRLPGVLRRALDAKGDDRPIWVLQPRRIAAKLAATFVAQQLGELVGQRVGYQVRHEQRQSAATRLLFMTYGVFAQRLRTPRALDGVSAVLLDEYHERGWQQDASLAWLWHQQQRGLPTPRFGVLSATLDGARLAAHLGDAPLFHLRGRQHALTVQYAPPPKGGSLVAHVAQQVLRALDTSSRGHLLAFVAGQRDIDAIVAALAGPAAQRGAKPFPLYARLSGEDQASALAPSTLRKLIVATNIAESSVTLDGVCEVVDSGQAFSPHEDPFTGVQSIRLAPISQASAIQRAGRAARQGPGRCTRLYSSADYSRRRAYDAPEVMRLELAPLVMWCARLGVDPASLPYFDPPPASALAAATSLLQRMGALVGQALSADGRQMMDLPLAPRLACVALRGLRLGLAPRTLADVVAVLKTPHDAPALPPNRAHGDSDLDDALPRVPHTPSWRQTSADVLRVLQSLPKPSQHSSTADAMAQALLPAFSDRIGKRLARPEGAFGSSTLAMAGGGSAALHANSCVQSASFVLCLAGHIDKRTGSTVIDLAAAIEAEDLLALGDGHVEERERTRLSAGGRAMRHSQLLYDGLSLYESTVEEPDVERRGEVFCQAWRSSPTEQNTLQQLQAQLLARLDCVAERTPALGTSPATWLADQVQKAATFLAQHCARSSEVTSPAIWDLAVGSLPTEVSGALTRFAPLEVKTRAGRRLAVRYSEHTGPFVESYVQDFFGHDAPLLLAPGMPGIVVHLWGPNRRAAQVTADLPNFWRVQYPSLRREWVRRYPNHAWPKDPTTATPPPPRAPKKRG